MVIDLGEVVVTIFTRVQGDVFQYHATVYDKGDHPAGPGFIAGHGKVEEVIEYVRDQRQQWKTDE